MSDESEKGIIDNALSQAVDCKVIWNEGVLHAEGTMNAEDLPSSQSKINPESAISCATFKL